MNENTRVCALSVYVFESHNLWDFPKYVYFLFHKSFYLVLLCFSGLLVPMFVWSLTDPPEKLQQICPTCPLLLPPDSEEAVEAAGIAMASYKRQSTLGADLGVLKIIRAASQVGLDAEDTVHL